MQRFVRRKGKSLMRFLEQMGLGVASMVSVLAVGLWIVSPAAALLPPDRGNLIVSGSASPNPGMRRRSRLPTR